MAARVRLTWIPAPIAAPPALLLGRAIAPMAFLQARERLPNLSQLYAVRRLLTSIVSFPLRTPDKPEGRRGNHHSSLPRIWL